MSQDCGCKVNAHCEEYSSDWVYEITYCPKHQAVDRLLEAAKKLLGHREEMEATGLPYYTNYSELKQAVLAAEGKE